MPSKKENIDTIIEKASQGDKAYQFKLGMRYRNGQDVEQSDENSFIWLKKSAEQGYHQAQNNLGWMYKQGIGVKQSYPDALFWYSKAADGGNALSLCSLGWMYEHGKGVEKDIKKAASLYKKSAEKGNATAQCNLGLFYEYGRGVTKDYTTAVNWYRKSAQQNHPRGNLKLGTFYIEQGDYTKALELLTKINGDSKYRDEAVEKIDKIERLILSTELTTIRDNILDTLKVDVNTLPTMTHYTSLSVGYSLLLEESPLRLGHINAVNDPNEGKLLWKLINMTPIEGNPIFIGCFLPDSDSLNMWRFYSKNNDNDDACGCAITYDIASFFDYNLLDHNTKKSSDNIIDTSSINNELSPSTYFYRVIYVDDNENLLNDKGGKLRKEFKKLKVATERFLGKDPKSEKYYELSRLLGPLPYLLKDEDYKDEQEHRIIVAHLEYGSSEIKYIAPNLETNTPPKLYLELHRDKHLTPIKHVTLGPKAPYKEMMAPYWHQILAMNFSEQLHNRSDFFIMASKCSYK